MKYSVILVLVISLRLDFMAQLLAHVAHVAPVSTKPPRFCTDKVYFRSDVNGNLITSW